MQKLLLSALAALTVLAAGSPAEAAMLCGGNGCNVIQTKPMQHRKFMPLGYTKPLQQVTPPAPSAPAATTLTSILQKL
jgi:hypothetical protein